MLREEVERMMTMMKGNRARGKRAEANGLQEGDVERVLQRLGEREGGIGIGQGRWEDEKMVRRFSCGLGSYRAEKKWSS
jgi:hypothetical protein